MAELFPVLIVIFILVSLTKKTKKAQKSGTKQTTAQPRQSMPRQAQPAVPVRPQQQAAVGQTINTPKGGVMKPRVATTIEVSKHDHSGMFEGSMQADSHEGMDPCHESELGEVRMPSTYSDRIINRSLEEEEEPQVAAPAIDLDWEDSKGLVKAFVMQEVLTRPCDRRR